MITGIYGALTCSQYGKHGGNSSHTFGFLNISSNPYNNATTLGNATFPIIWMTICFNLGFAFPLSIGSPKSQHRSRTALEKHEILPLCLSSILNIFDII